MSVSPPDLEEVTTCYTATLRKGITEIIQQSIKIFLSNRCQVDAKPKSTTFRWLFNSSDTNFEIPSAEASMSFGNYRATEGGDRGEVLCWATNSLGEQVCLINA